MDSCQPRNSIEPHISNKENDELNDKAELENSGSVDEEGSKSDGDNDREKPGSSCGKKKRKNLFVPDIKLKKPKQLLD